MPVTSGVAQIETLGVILLAAAKCAASPSSNRRIARCSRRSCGPAPRHVLLPDSEILVDNPEGASDEPREVTWVDSDTFWTTF